jgi:lauroyl/myristoyl acyltransferase
VTLANGNGNGAAPTGRRSGASSEAATKTFEAPHRRDKETLAARVAGETLARFWRTSSWILGHLPAGPSYKVGGWLAMIGYAASPTRRKWLRANFGHVLGVSPDSREAHRMARAAYRNYARYIIELMRLPWLPREKAESMLEVASLEKFINIYHRANGVVLVAGHIGNNEAVAAGFAKHGLAINVVGDDSSYQALYKLFEQQRESWGLKMISWRNLRSMYGALKRREALVLLIDWGYRGDGIPVKLFDEWTTLPAGPAILAAKHGSVIVPVAMARLADGTFRAEAGDPITCASTSPRDVAVATQLVADEIQRLIAAAPEQWYNFKTIWPLQESECVELEARHEAAMANDAKGAAPRTTATAAPGTAPVSVRSEPPQPAEP